MSVGSTSVLNRFAGTGESTTVRAGEKGAGAVLVELAALRLHKGLPYDWSGVSALMSSAKAMGEGL